MLRRSTLVAVLVFAFTPHAAASVLCKGKAATAVALKVRAAACKSTEVQVDPISLGIGPSAVWKDANGASVGAVTNAGSGPISILSTTGSRAITVDTDGNGYLNDRALLLYTEAGCAGTPLLVPLSGVFSPFSVPVPAAGTHAGIVYFPSASPSSTFIVTSKTLAPFSGSQAGCDSGLPGSGTVFTPPDGCCGPVNGPSPAAPIGILDLSGFVQPFRIEVR
jgi:hypothetical protein